jgi:hypothetical protein
MRVCRTDEGVRVVIYCEVLDIFVILDGKDSARSDWGRERIV